MPIEKTVYEVHCYLACGRIWNSPTKDTVCKYCGSPSTATVEERTNVITIGGLNGY